MQVEYFKMDGVPEQDYFYCEQYRATLSVQACAAMWREANSGRSTRNLSCLRCPIGARHAGVTNASTSKVRGASICARCHRRDRRLIHKSMCVSCYNREREILAGKNAKGSPPSRLPALGARSIRYRSGQRLVDVHVERSVDLSELIVGALRDSVRRVSFGFCVTHDARQPRLW